MFLVLGELELIVLQGACVWLRLEVRAIRSERSLRIFQLVEIALRKMPRQKTHFTRLITSDPL